MCCKCKCTCRDVIKNVAVSLTSWKAERFEIGQKVRFKGSYNPYVVVRFIGQGTGRVAVRPTTHGNPYGRETVTHWSNITRY